MKNEVNPITKSIDTLWTITIFYGLYQLSQLRGFWPILIGILTTLLLINEWFYVRATFDFYSDPMFVADLIDVFLYILAYSALSSPSEFSYSTTYWLYLSLIWFIYFLWDVSVLPFTQDKTSAQSLRNWMFGMLISSIFTFGSFLFLFWVEYRHLSIQYHFISEVLQYLNLAIIAIVLFTWNKKKIQTIRNAFQKAGPQ